MPYVTGSNTPGYLPDADPSPSATWAEACAALIEAVEDEAERYAEGLPDDDLRDNAVAELDALRDEALAEIAEATPEQPFDVRFNGRVFFVADAPADLNVYTYQMTDGETEIFWALDPEATPLALVPFQGERDDPAALARHERLVKTLCAAMKADSEA